MLIFSKCRFWALVFLCAVAGCVTSSTGIAIGVRGRLTMRIIQDRGSSSASLTATIALTGTGTNLLLEDDQVLSVNGAALTPDFLGFGRLSAIITAVEPPDNYVITFDDQGTVGTMTVAPPSSLIEVTGPASNSEVALSGFTVSWSTSGEVDVMVEISIDDVLVSSVPDDGSATLGEADLVPKQACGGWLLAGGAARAGGRSVDRSPYFRGE